MRGVGNLGFRGEKVAMRSSSDMGSATLWKMRRSVTVWFAIAAVVCTAVMFVAVGPWLQSNIKRGLDSFLVGKSNEIEVRPRHDPPWRQRHDVDNNVSLGWSFCFFYQFFELLIGVSGLPRVACLEV